MFRFPENEIKISEKNSKFLRKILLQKLVPFFGIGTKLLIFIVKIAI